MWLRGGISYDGSAFEAGIKKSTATAQKGGQDIGAAFQTGIKGRLGQAFSAAAIIAGVEALIRTGIDAASQIKDQAEQWNTSTDAVQRITNALANGGLAAETFTSALAALGQARRDASEGDEAARKRLKEYGMTLEDVRNETMGTVEFAEKLAASIAKMNLTPAQRSGLRDLLGRNAERMLNAIQDISKETAAMEASAIKAADAFDKMIERMKRSAKAGIVNSIFGDKNFVNVAGMMGGAAMPAGTFNPARNGELNDYPRPLEPQDSVNGISDPLYYKNEAASAKALNALYEQGLKIQFEKIGAFGRIKQLTQEIAALQIAADEYSTDSDKEEFYRTQREIAKKKMELENERLNDPIATMSYTRSARHAFGAYSGPNPLLDVNKNQLAVLKQILTATREQKPAGLAIRVP